MAGRDGRGLHCAIHGEQRVGRTGIMDRRDQSRGHSVRIFDVVHHVAMDEPRPRRRIGIDRDVDALPWGDEDRVLDVAIVDRLGVARDNLLVMPMGVHGVELFAGDVDPADPKVLAGATIIAPYSPESSIASLSWL